MRNRYGALSSTLQSSNGNFNGNNGGKSATPLPRTPKRKIAGTGTTGSGTATPASRKRARKVLVEEETSGVGHDGGKENGDEENGANSEEGEDSVSAPAVKKARTTVKARAGGAGGGAKIKSEFVPEEVLVEEDDGVGIF